MARKPALNLITVEQAASQLSLHHRTIRRYIAQGKLTGHRVGDWAVRVDQAELTALVRPIPAAGNGRAG